ncbi:unnamed protein product [Protopolystoma xenopodis]|uniref:Uncharacterized protein n=1 Tax=Protopolystoma xenopodis TaxID=117903 RepID=A0A3S5A5J6_9PLAT|nr:unnamed protein product [Protopolystoma xenopodis]
MASRAKFYLFRIPYLITGQDEDSPRQRPSGDHFERARFPPGHSASVAESGGGGRDKVPPPHSQPSLFQPVNADLGPNNEDSGLVADASSNNKENRHDVQHSDNDQRFGVNNGFDRLSTAGHLTRDEFSLHKMIVVATSAGKVAILI